MTEQAQTWRRIQFFLLLTLAISAVFWFLIIRTGRLGAGRGLFLTGLMWAPGVAGLLSRWRCDKSLVGHGWAWGNARLQLASYLIPLGYASAVYVPSWLTGIGGFYDQSFLAARAADAGWSGLPPLLQLILFALFTGTLGMPASCATALGEELGWRGFLVPELAKVTRFTNVAVLSGVMWSLWHYPIFLFADYHSGTPAWFGLSCFTVMAVGISFAFAWLRLKTGSIWTAVLLHGSHNLFVQGVFSPLTIATSATPFITGEFGLGFAIVGCLVGYTFWRRGVADGGRGSAVCATLAVRAQRGGATVPVRRNRTESSGTRRRSCT